MQRVLLLAASIVAAGATAAAAAPAAAPTRTVTERADYAAPTIGVDNVPGEDWVGECFDTPPRIGCANFHVPAGARTLSLKFADASGTSVHAYVMQGTTETGADRQIAEICGSTTHPIRLRNRQPVWVMFYTGHCPDLRPSVVTQGTLTATFTVEN